MAHAAVRDLPALVNSSGSSTVTAGIGNLDDAASVTIFLSTANNILSSNCQFQVSQFEPAFSSGVPVGTAAVIPTGVSWSTLWYPLVIGSSVALTSGAQAFIIAPVSFRGIRIQCSANTITTGTTIAFACKQINV